MTSKPDPKDRLTPPEAVNPPVSTDETATKEPSKEYGGQKGPEPTRYGDWEKAGRCTDF